MSAAQELGDTGHLVHSGILASAEWLSERLSCIAQVCISRSFTSICVCVRGGFQ